MAVEEPAPENGQALADPNTIKRKQRFVQLYTSKSYESRRSELVNPPENDGGMRRSGSTENLQKHVLSPRLVDAISQTTQVVWANTKKQEGLTGRSDIRLQTAVGMPVAMDSEGNMCIVVMFSPNNIQSSDEAMEFLQSISLSATSSSIPCLMPVYDVNSSDPRLKQLPHLDDAEHHMIPHPDPGTFGEGVTARFVSLEEKPEQGRSNSIGSDEPEIHSEHELATAPKDTFGIPMLPSFAELGNVTPEENVDVFDEASYGIWNTIMDADGSSGFDFKRDLKNDDDFLSAEQGETKMDPSLQVMLPAQQVMSEARKERLEEFLSAFLGMSVFDLADVWVPASKEGYPDCLRHVASISSTNNNQRLNEFMMTSEHALIKYWTGAVGRAFSSGNPVWSANPNVFVDAGRAQGFNMANVQTVLAVPVFSAKASLPSCVVACYSLVRSGSVPFVLKFVQQALRLLWEGLDKFEPHESVCKDTWGRVNPADLGEMAADLEMQHHFFKKKRPHNLISDVAYTSVPSRDDAQTSALSTTLQSISLPNGDVITVPLQLSEEDQLGSSQEINVQHIQSHLNEAVRSVRNAVPFNDQATTSPASKKAHVMTPINTGSAGKFMPLPRPLGFPTQVVSSNISAPPQPMSQDLPIYPVPEVQQQYGNFQGETKFNDAMPAPMQVKSPFPAAEFPAQTFNNNTTPQFCQPISAAVSISESTENTTTSGSKRCRIQGCDDPALSRRPYCERHSGNRQCEHPGCSKCAQGCTRFCIAHGGGRRCTFPGCDKGARDKFFCAAHGGGKRCKHEGCSKSAVGGSNLCTAHGGGRRCAVDGCDKSAQSSTKFCVKHGGGKKCAHEGCEKVARGRTPFCAAHGGGVRCKLEGCNRVAIGKMQLCRAHGGFSSRARKKKGQEEEEDEEEDYGFNADPIPLSSHEFQQMQRMPQFQQQQQGMYQGGMDYMTSV